MLYNKDNMTKQLTGNKPLTPKQKAFVAHIVNNPKDSATEAAIQTYKTTDRATAAQIAHDNLTKPNIVTELSKYNNMVENTLINTINDYKDSDKIAERSLATDTAKWVHDKIHGKAIQQVQTSSTKLVLSIDLTSTDETTDTDIV